MYFQDKNANVVYTTKSTVFLKDGDLKSADCSCHSFYNHVFRSFLKTFTYLWRVPRKCYKNRSICKLDKYLSKKLS